ncbi:MAG: hypothetical protein PHH00_03830 [Candidatus Nanoarchaeia archaeon]|nr:hypothetical protein [Candidatus Nanoarchaeia archaeon]
MSGLLSVEIFVEIFVAISSAIFWKIHKDNPAEEVYNILFSISLIIAIIDLLALIPITIKFNW